VILLFLQFYIISLANVIKMKMNPIHMIITVLYWILCGPLWHMQPSFILRLNLNQVSGTGLIHISAQQYCDIFIYIFHVPSFHPYFSCIPGMYHAGMGHRNITHFLSTLEIRGLRHTSKSRSGSTSKLWPKSPVMMPSQLNPVQLLIGIASRHICGP